MGSVKDTDRGYKKAIRSLRKAAGKRHVVVGIRSEKGSATAEGDSLNLAGIAAVNEFGSKDGHVPERSFLRSTFDAGKDRYAGVIEEALGRVTDGTSDIEKELGLLGLRVTADVQRTIAAGVPPPNAPSTIRRKRGSSGQLRDTGRLTQSLDHEVRGGSAS